MSGPVVIFVRPGRAEVVMPNSNKWRWRAHRLQAIVLVRMGAGRSLLRS
jgi:hypothetical protein